MMLEICSVTLEICMNTDARDMLGDARDMLSDAKNMLSDARDKLRDATDMLPSIQNTVRTQYMLHYRRKCIEITLLIFLTQQYRLFSNYSAFLQIGLC